MLSTAVLTMEPGFAPQPMEPAAILSSREDAHFLPYLHKRLTRLLSGRGSNNILGEHGTSIRTEDHNGAPAVIECTKTLSSADLRPWSLDPVHVLDRADEHSSDSHDRDLRRPTLDNHDAPSVLAVNVQGTWLVDGLRVDCVVRPIHLFDALDNAAGGSMPAVVVLRRQASNHYRATVERLCQAIVTAEKLGDREPIPLDPVLLREVNCRKGSKTAIRRTRYDKVIVDVCNRSSFRTDLAGKEAVEVGVFSWVWLDELVKRGADIKALNERLDMRFALWGIIFMAHLDALGFQQMFGFLPLQ